MYQIFKFRFFSGIFGTKNTKSFYKDKKLKKVKILLKPYKLVVIKLQDDQNDIFL